MVTPKGRMNPQPSGMTVPDESFRVDPSHFPRPQEPVNPLSGYGRNPFGTALWNTAIGMGKATGDIGRSFFDPTSWRWGKDERGDPVEYNPAFQPGPDDPMAQRAGYGLIDAMAVGLPTGAPDFESMTDLDAAMQVFDVVDPSGLGGDVAKLSVKVIDFDTVASAFGVLTAKGKDLLKNTKAVDDAGEPLVMYHGSRVGFDEFDPATRDYGAVFGPGAYFTSDVDIAHGYSGFNFWKDSPTTSMQPTIHRTYLDVRNPIDMDAYKDPDVVSVMFDTAFRIPSTTPQIKFDKYQAGQMLEILRREFTIIRNRHNSKIGTFGSVPTSLPKSLDRKHIDVAKFIENGELDKAHKGLREIADATVVTNEDAYFLTLNLMNTHTLQDIKYHKLELQEIFSDKGYDSITHIGRGRSGNKPHRVYVVFSDTVADPDTLDPSYMNRILPFTHGEAALPPQGTGGVLPIANIEPSFSNELGRGVYFSTDRKIAEGYAEGIAPFAGNVSPRPRKGTEIVSEFHIPKNTKIFSRDETVDNVLFKELSENPNFMRTWNLDWQRALPTRNNIWAAAEESRMLPELQRLLENKGYKGARHAQGPDKWDYAIWDSLIIREGKGPLNFFRGAPPPQGTGGVLP